MTTSSHAISRSDSPSEAGPSGGGDPAIAPSVVRRIIARALDMFTVLFLTLALIALGLAPLVHATTRRVAPEPWGDAFVATLLYATVASVYEVCFLVARGQTPGKDLLNIRVVDAVDGSTPGWMCAVRRTAPFALLRLVPGAALGSVAVLVTGVSAPFDVRRRGLHDRFAGTVVEAYDADLAEGDSPDVDHRAVARRYGPLSIFGQSARRGDATDPDGNPADNPADDLSVLRPPGGSGQT